MTVSVLKRIKARAKRRSLRTRERLQQNMSLPRASVFRSLKHIYAQIIDDNQHATLASVSSLDLDQKIGDKTAVARAMGVELAKRAKNAGIEAVRFDRGSYLYHGRVKALCEGLREGGLNV